jgi:hypothetical protein
VCVCVCVYVCLSVCLELTMFLPLSFLSAGIIGVYHYTQVQGFLPRLCAHITGTLLLEPHFQSILLWLFLEMESLELCVWAGFKP